MRVYTYECVYVYWFFKIYVKIVLAFQVNKYTVYTHM